MQNWRKLGLIFCPAGDVPWMETHAANPVAVQVDSDRFAVYFTGRNRTNVSSIGRLYLNMASLRVETVDAEPVISPGEPGLFDDSGTAMGFYLLIHGVPHIYYLGWNLKVTVPWLNSIGLARFDPLENRFLKVSRAPVVDRSNEDPFSISYPSVLFENGVYRMWYGSNLAWGPTQETMQHVIKYAESTDGYHWNRTGMIALPLESPGEYALSKPYVIKTESGYSMWYSYRAGFKGAGYRIGYAASEDGIRWHRQDQVVGLDVTPGSWDSEMICYACPFYYKERLYMLYNGNGYGKTGFGLAVLE